MAWRTGLGGASLRARVLLAARWPAALALGLVAGIGAGAVIGLLTIARDTGSALDRYLRSVGEPDLAATFCPPGVSGSGPQAAACLTHDPVAELHALQRDPAVRAAGRVSPTPLSVRGTKGWEPLFSWVRYDGVRLYEHPRILEGRLARDDAPDEAEVSELLARTHHLRPGSQLEVAGISWDQFSHGSGQFEAPALPPRTITVTGVVRLPTDLTAVDEPGPANLNAEVIFLGPGWVRATGEDTFARFQTSVAIRFRPDADRAAVLDAAAPGQTRNVAEGVVADDLGDTRGTVAYEGRAATVAAGVLAAAMAVLLGQMFVRQARRELPDGPALRALGMTRRALVLSVVPRWLVTTAVALGTAAALSAFLRPLGPIGVVARRAVAPAGPSWSASTLGLGLLATALFVIAIPLLATARAAGGERAAAAARRAVAAPLPVAPSVGLSITRTSSSRWLPRTSALLGVTIAVATATAAPTLLSSLHHLTSEPARYGATWDVLVSDPLGPASAASVADRLRSIGGVEAAGGLTGNTARIGSRELYVYAISPLDGLAAGIVPTITRGRAPAAPNEIALGSRSMADAGIDVGDPVELTYLDTPHRLTVVGEAVINDGHEPIPGLGAIVTPEWLRSVDQASYVSDFAVRFSPEARRAGVAAVEREFTGWTTGPVAPHGVVNLERISGWPAVLAVLMATIAVVAFLHALVLTVRTQRRPLAVLRALGSSRPQLAGAVVWHAVFLTVPAVAVGVPLGVALGRAAWGVFARNLGVASGPIVPLASLVLAAVVTLALTAVLAVGPSWRAARVGTTEALRAE